MNAADQQRDMFAAVMERSETAILILAPDFSILAINQKNIREIEDIYGVTTKIGDNFSEILTRAKVTEHWLRAFAGETVAFTQTFGDLERRIYEMRFDPVYDQDRTLVGACCSALEVTARFEAERKLAVAQEELHHIQKVEAFGHLGSTFVHEFNNLLAPVVLILDGLSTRTFDPVTDKNIAQASLAARQAAELSKKLMALSRRHKQEVVNIDMTKLIEDIRPVIELTCGRNIKIEYNLSCDIDPLVNSDASQLAAAILNIVTNARDAMPRGGTLTLSLRCQDGFVNIEVSDNGEGISPDNLPHVTVPFFTTKKSGYGSGLGLTMVDRLCRQMGGSLSISSSIEIGTVVRMNFPAVNLT